MSELTSLDERINRLVPAVDEGIRAELRQILRTLQAAGNPVGALLQVPRVTIRLFRQIYAAAGHPMPSENLDDVLTRAAGGRPEMNIPGKGKIGVLVEAHFDETEFRRFGEFFPEHGYAVEYLSHLWGQNSLTFEGNDGTARVTVTREVNDAVPAAYAGLILIDGYAMDRLRYEPNPQQGRPNQAPAVVFLRKAVAAMDAGRLRIGTIGHGLWLFFAAPELLKGRKVTCAHNILYDVINAGGIPIYDDKQQTTADTYVDGNLITAQHPGVLEEFMHVFVRELERESDRILPGVQRAREHTVRWLWYPEAQGLEESG
jgi:putative intracellular protease/amidase